MNKFSLIFTLSILLLPLAAQADYRDRTASRGVEGPAARSMPFPFLHQAPMHHEEFRPYLNNLRHEQIPQWENKNWYVEDWTSQKDGKELVKGFYKANIIMDQKTGHDDLPILVVGPNFYHLSGLDKRRVVQTIDTVYGMTDQKENGSFLLKDWHSNHYIGAFDQHGLRLY